MDLSQPITEAALSAELGLPRLDIARLRSRFLSETAKHYHAHPETREIIINPSGIALLLEKLTAPEIEKKDAPPAPLPPPVPETDKKAAPLILTVIGRQRNQRYVRATDGKRKDLVVKVLNNLDWQLGDTLPVSPVPGLPHSFTHTGPRPKRSNRSVWVTAKKEGGAP